MSQKTLIIVESPAKSNTISKYLGSDYLVSSSMGHVRDLNPNILSIDVEKNYKPYYEEVKDKKSIIKKLKELSQKSEKILLAPDPDREGEAIAYHLREILKSSNRKIFRIFFNEITKQAILQAVENPRDIDIDKVNSQQMRRLLDRLAGYKISPVLQRKIGGPLSAGRVQSVALKLIVEREREIRAFEPEEYWAITAQLEGSKKPPFNAKLEKHNNKKIKIVNKEQNDEVVDNLKKNDYVLNKIKKTLKKRKSPPPLITSSLQQEAFRRFGLPVKSTMRLAQSLYEGVDLGRGERTGLITYMRTDSYRISNDARAAAKNFITASFGAEYYPDKPNFYGSKKKIQDAHETIRPTLPFHAPADINKYLNANQFKIYRLIWDRFFASQMKEAQVEETIFQIANGDYLFISKGEIEKFPGFTKILKIGSNAEQLPGLNEQEILKLLKLNPKQNFTKPPARYTEASLVKVLEEKGIGRPSTYASIIDTLGKRAYVYKEEKKFVPTFLGFNVAEYLDKNFKDIMNYNFTADLEKQLDLVSEGSLDWIKGIDDFYKKLLVDLGRVEGTDRVQLSTGKKCPRCGKDLVLKYSYKTRGWFSGCSGYPECKYTEKGDGNNQTEVKKDELLDRTCPKPGCGEPLVKRYSAKTRSYFIGCSGYPKCTYIETLKDEKLGDCPTCGKPLLKRFSKKTRRFFTGCSGYPECTYIESRVNRKKGGKIKDAEEKKTETDAIRK
ncbi:MAG: type I DNA topoisomerase [Candidatus Aminicenantes bacterium]|nr:type I DNA topoisomerase [Candidatus Aminicenantes bacterium]